MPSAALIRRVGFPTALTALLLLWLTLGPAQAALSPPPVRLAEVFQRQLWAAGAPSLEVPVVAGSHPIPYEVP